VLRRLLVLKNDVTPFPLGFWLRITATCSFFGLHIFNIAVLSPKSHKINSNTILTYTQPIKKKSSHPPTKMKQAGINFAEALVPFGGSAPTVNEPDKAILGGKGLGLQEMSRIGVDVPPGFTLVTTLCPVYEKENDLPAEMWNMVQEAIQRVESDTGKQFGADENPLLFSCRSGAAISMPGMMDTVLNIVSNTS
jgi:hypothetical protein